MRNQRVWWRVPRSAPVFLRVELGYKGFLSIYLNAAAALWVHFVGILFLCWSFHTASEEKLVEFLAAKAASWADSGNLADWCPVVIVLFNKELYTIPLFQGLRAFLRLVFVKPLVPV